ncbi:AI-2E family transporter [Mechercharimyces sp. CAU 1602]|uniref:AI-2E family transporter n=1 Tax=Mechercharimyces sp. CAU 1602 TaxID=2973933 RepID=UPI002161144A|nr:AI-2E family transporter [Mechercharimyces sp. CAU 1602]MCS1350259.1 AI-2E family transporter [Mechercharimyces sp. CAU 1602]
MKWIPKESHIQVALFVLLLSAIMFLLVQMNPFFAGIWHFIKTIFTPFLFAIIISYLLNPVVSALSNRAVPRSIAVLLIYALFIGSLTIVFMNTAPLLNQQWVELMEHLPQWHSEMHEWMDQYNHNKELLPESVRNGIEQSLAQVEEKISNLISDTTGGLESTLNQLFIAFIIPFLAFYMLKDVAVIEKSMVSLLPGKQRRDILRVVKDIDRALGNYVRGQLLVCLVVGVLSYIGYLVIGMPYALLLALVVALFNVIPFLGPFIGAIPAFFVALTISFKMVLLVIAVNLVVQVLEGNVLSPQIVGRSLRMHPLFIIFALLVGGELGGILGLILAVPFFAACKVVVDHLIAHSLRS